MKITKTLLVCTMVAALFALTACGRGTDGDTGKNDTENNEHAYVNDVTDGTQTEDDKSRDDDTDADGRKDDEKDEDGRATENAAGSSTEDAGIGDAASDVLEDAGSAVDDVADDAGNVVEDAAQGAGNAIEDVTN